MSGRKIIFVGDANPFAPLPSHSTVERTARRSSGPKPLPPDPDKELADPHEVDRLKSLFALARRNPASASALVEAVASLRKQAAGLGAINRVKANACIVAANFGDKLLNQLMRELGENKGESN